MLNHSADYALRATLYMAHASPNQVYKATAIADALNLPGNYLSKIMHELVRARVLTSVRGPAGGYTFAIPPTQLSLERIIAPFQDVSSSPRCLMGDRACDRMNPCVAHQRWEQIRDTFVDRLRNTKLADLLTPIMDKPNTLTLTEVA